MIYVIATITAEPGKGTQLIKAARNCIDATRREDGCISYDYCQDTDNLDMIVVVERWSSREALGKHFVAPHMETWRTERQGLLKSAKVEVIHAGQVEVI